MGPPSVARLTASRIKHAGVRLARLATILRSGRWLELGQYRGDYSRMERIYLLDDPWNLRSPREVMRFKLINEVVATVVPVRGAILEIGSGEGAQTACLSPIAGSVTGLEVSRAAIERARVRVPEAEFVHGRAEDAASLFAGRRFGLVTACEVLYYSRDPAAILAQLQCLAPAILVVNYERRAAPLERHLRGPGWKRLDDLGWGNTVWRCHLWRADSAGGSR